MEQPKIWMADVIDVDGKRQCAIVIAPHLTAATQTVSHGVSKIEDIFEIDISDPRWHNLHISGKLLTPERF